MAIVRHAPFNPSFFLAHLGDGGSVAKYSKNDVVFSQGEPADSVFYIQKGRAKLTVVSEQGKEAIVAIVAADEFFGEGCLAGQPLRISTVSAMTESVIVRVEKAAFVRAIQQESAFSELFMAYLLGRTIRVESDLIDQLFKIGRAHV